MPTRLSNLNFFISQDRYAAVLEPWRIRGILRSFLRVIVTPSVEMKEEGLLREILDSKSIAFSILTLCESTTRRGTIGTLNANFCLGSCPNQLKRSRHYVIEQGYLATNPQARQVRLRKKAQNCVAHFQGRSRRAPRRMRDQAQSKRDFSVARIIIAPAPIHNRRAS